MKEDQRVLGGGRNPFVVRLLTDFNNLSKSNKKGFTLAEVLITLAIIGIVAVLVIPGMVNSYTEKQHVAKLKKAYQNLTVAYNLSYAENGDIMDYIRQKDPQPNWYHTQCHQAFRDYFMNYYKNIKKGGVKYGKGANFYRDWAKSSTYDARDCDSFSTFMTTDGTLYSFRYLGFNSSFGTWGNDGTNLGRSSGGIVGFVFVYLDFKTNRIAQLGKDVFYFSIGMYEPRVTPGGATTMNTEPLKCYSSLADCTQWVVTNDNMDYWHCDDLSWKGRRKCDGF